EAMAVPDLSAGRCQPGNHPAEMRGAWTSERPLLREAATWYCTACPVLEPCRTWALDGMAVSTWSGCDTSIGAGMTRAERGAARRPARRPPRGQPVPPSVRYPGTSVRPAAAAASAAAAAPAPSVAVTRAPTHDRATRAAASAPAPMIVAVVPGR